jgi:hypothetical protein
MTNDAFHQIFLPLMGAGGATALMVLGVGVLARRDGRKR